MSGAAAAGEGRSGDSAGRWANWKLLALGLLSASSVLATAPAAQAMSREEKRRLGNQVVEMFDHAYSNYMDSQSLLHPPSPPMQKDTSKGH